MQFEEDSIHECPHCHGLMRQGYGNTLPRTQHWSDGFIKDRADAVRLARCPHCAVMYWLEARSRHEPQGRDRVVRTPRKWKFGHRPDVQVIYEDTPVTKLPYIMQPDLAELKEAITLPATTSVPEREAYIRVRIWWALNHLYRADLEAVPPPETEAAIRSNLEKLLPLLEHNRSRTAEMRVRVLVALGRFDEAAAVLYSIPTNRASDIFWEKLRQAIEQRKSRLFREW